MQGKSRVPGSGHVPGTPTGARKHSTLGARVNAPEVNTRVGDTLASIGFVAVFLRICTAALVISILVRGLTIGLPIPTCFHRVSVLLTRLARNRVPVNEICSAICSLLVLLYLLRSFPVG